MKSRFDDPSGEKGDGKGGFWGLTSGFAYVIAPRVSTPGIADLFAA
jgi:hypothetical protein